MVTQSQKVNEAINKPVTCQIFFVAGFGLDESIAMFEEAVKRAISREERLARVMDESVQFKGGQICIHFDESFTLSCSHIFYCLNSH